jgi:peptidoglycan hydrolase-like protein with peptidoglycan-binding domain
MLTVSQFYNQEPSASQRFGADRGNGRKHRGADLSHSTRPGTPVPALLGGKIIGKLSPASWHGFGYQVTIESSYNGRRYRISYAHGSAASPLAVGATVRAGQQVITEGNTGATSGSCVHIELFDIGLGRYIDPMPLIRAVRQGTSTAPSGTVGKVTVKRAVSDIQRLVGAKVDNRYGPDTTAKVKTWQSAHGLNPDGIWGPASDAKGFPKAPPAPPAHGNPFGISNVQGLQKIAKLYGYRGDIDNIWGGGSAAGFAEYLRKNYGYRGNDVLGPNMWAAIARWLRKKWGYVGNDVPGPNMRRALSTANQKNYEQL